jgi:hypothetical protein
MRSKTCQYGADTLVQSHLMAAPSEVAGADDLSRRQFSFSHFSHGKLSTGRGCENISILNIYLLNKRKN